MHADIRLGGNGYRNPPATPMVGDAEGRQGGMNGVPDCSPDPDQDVGPMCGSMRRMAG